MKLRDAKRHIEEKLSYDDSLIGFFTAQEPPKIWVYLLIGVLSILFMKHYFIAITQKGICFHKLNKTDKFETSKFYEFEQIKNIKVGRGFFQRPLTFQFRDGNIIKIKAQIKGAKRVALFTEEMQQHIRYHIQII
jgi:hypothetical protein